MKLNDLASAVYQDADFKKYHPSISKEMIQSEIERYFETKIGSKTETGQDILYMAFTVCDVKNWEAIA